MKTRLTSGAAGTLALTVRRAATVLLTARRAATVLLMMLLTTATAWAETVTANYMNADGTTSSHSATVINQSNMPTTLGTNDTESWYVVTENVSYTEDVLFRGDVYLILGDGKTMSIGTEDNPISDNPGLRRGNDNASLTIYGATADGGTLKAYNNYNGGSCLVIGKSFTLNSGSIIIKSLQSYAISAYYGDIIINGGKLDATSTGSNDAIYCLKTVNINGGNVTATTTGNSNGIDSANGITINGGNVTTCGYFGLHSFSGNITINGGNVTSTGNGYNNTIGWIYSYQGNIILGWTNDTDYINVGGYDVYQGVISVASGKSFQDANGNIYMGILFDGQTPAIGKFDTCGDLNDAIGGKILTPTGSNVTFYDVSIASTTNGTVTANYASAPEGTVVRLNVTPAEGYSIGTVKYNDGSDHVITPVNGVYSFTMPAKNVTVSATFTVMASDHFTQNGDEYTIHDADGWVEFCDAIDGGESFSGKTVKLGNDIEVSRCAGSGTDQEHAMNEHPFCGTFNGQGNTLTFTYGSSGSPANEDYTAPFRYVNGATIEHLHVGGTIYTQHTHAGGIVGLAYGSTTITDCHSSVNIVSSINGDGTHGGIMACTWTSSSTEISGCLFDGKLLTTDGTTNCGGFVGWRNGTLTISNSLYAPATITTGETEISGGSYTFARNWSGTPSNSYYTRTLGTVQGKQRHSITAGENVTVALSGTATEYETSGITAYKNDDTQLPGIKYGGVLYAGNGDNVSLTLSNSVGSGYSYTVNAGTLSDNTLTMPDADVVVSLGNNTNADWLTEYSGTEDDPYMIYNTDQLNLLAYRVNGTHDQTRQEDGFEGKYFKLGDDITYTYTKAWNEATCIDNNYEPIGGYYNNSNRYFRGNFDGDGHTISGIRIYKNGNDNAYIMNGIFGGTEGANIHDLTLADTRITGYNYTGGIAGKNASKLSGAVTTPGTITRCHVAADVAICAAQTYTWYHGGIVGCNFASSTVSQCTSAATLTTYNANDSYYYGGIAGYNEGMLTDNLAIGATVPAAAKNYYGAIAGFQGTLQRNYYYNCNVAGVQNATGVGSQNVDVTETTDHHDGVTYYNGALPGIILYDNSPKIDINSHILTTVGNAAVPRVTLSGRTLFKDGAWNTLCLPFSLTAEQIAAHADFAGATLMELDTKGKNGFDPTDGTLWLTFKTATTIEAGKPYIVKWTTTGDNIVDPVFSGVTVSSTPAATVEAKNSGLNTVQFIGTYSPTDIYSADKDNFYLGASNYLYYPWADGMTEYYLKACRAYFHVDLTGSANVRAFVLNFGDEEASGITTTDFLRPDGSKRAELERTDYTDYTDSDDSWYSLDGRKLDKRPIKAGLYIYGGKKVVIK